MVIGHSDPEDGRSSKREQLRDHNAQAQTERKRYHSHQHRFIDDDARDLDRFHAQHEIHAEFTLASPDQERVSINDQKRQHEGDDVGEERDHLIHKRRYIHVRGFVDLGHDVLLRNGVERIEERYRHEQRYEIDRVILHRPANITQSDFNQHGAPPLLGRSRPP